jgi:hypothetical protein
VTFAAFLAVGLWSVFRAKKNIPIQWSLAIAVCIAGGLLVSTAWHGGELVYRHGLGVMSLPNPDEHAHGDATAHDHGLESSGQQAAHEHDDGHDEHAEEMQALPEDGSHDAHQESGEDSHVPSPESKSSAQPQSDHTHEPGQEPHEH